MQALGISTLAIQTAGYSGKAMAEIRIEGMEHAEELRELIRSLVRQPGGGDGTGGAHAPPAAATTDQRILKGTGHHTAAAGKAAKKKNYFFSVISAGAFAGCFPFLHR
jgi:hypothetical protein